MTRRSQPTVGVDTGGTFTDAVYEGSDGRRTAKVPSTPTAPAEGFLAALAAADAHDARVRHGTTVGTNAVLTRPTAALPLGHAGLINRLQNLRDRRLFSFENSDLPRCQRNPHFHYKNLNR